MNLIKLVFNMIWFMGKTKDLAKRTQSYKVLKDKAFKIASHPKYDGYQRGLASIFCRFFDKKSSGSGIDSRYVAEEGVGGGAMGAKAPALRKSFPLY